MSLLSSLNLTCEPWRNRRPDERRYRRPSCPGRAEALGLDSASVDVGVVSLMLCARDDQGQALSELFRVIRPGGVSCGSSNTWRWRGAPHRAEGGGCDHLAVSDWRLLHRPGSCCCHLASRSWPRAVASTAVPEFAFGCRQRHTCSESLDDHTADGNPGQCRDGDARSRHRLVSAAGSTDQRNTSSTVTAVTTTREVAGGPSEDD